MGSSKDKILRIPVLWPSSTRLLGGRSQALLARHNSRLVSKWHTHSGLLIETCCGLLNHDSALLGSTTKLGGGIASAKSSRVGLHRLQGLLTWTDGAPLFHLHLRNDWIARRRHLLSGLVVHCDLLVQVPQIAYFHVDRVLLVELRRHLKRLTLDVARLSSG